MLTLQPHDTAHDADPARFSLACEVWLRGERWRVMAETYAPDDRFA